MTTDPDKQALVDQATADTSRFVDDILTEMVTLIERGMPHMGVIEQIGGGMAMHGLNDTQMLVVAAVATARLARLHHALKQLADRWQASGSALVNAADPEANTMDAVDKLAEGRSLLQAVGELRKLVEDHG